MPNYELVTNVESMTHPGVMYEIKRNIDTDHLSCSCPAFRFDAEGKKLIGHARPLEERNCKHTYLIQEKGIWQVQSEARTRRNNSITESELESMLTQALVEANPVAVSSGKK